MSRMCHCITPQALLSGLVRRMQREGYAPTERDVRGLLGSGCKREDVLATIDRLGGEPAARLRALVEAHG
jgi:hypothetical protein